jgi:hypothetical protein
MDSYSQIALYDNDDIIYPMKAVPQEISMRRIIVFGVSILVLAACAGQAVPQTGIGPNVVVYKSPT